MPFLPNGVNNKNLPNLDLSNHVKQQIVALMNTILEKKVVLKNFVFYI